MEKDISNSGGGLLWRTFVLALEGLAITAPGGLKSQISCQ